MKGALRALNRAIAQLRADREINPEVREACLENLLVVKDQLVRQLALRY